MLNIRRRIATLCLVAAGLAANLGSNFTDLGPCTEITSGSTLYGNNQTGVAGAPLGRGLAVDAQCRTKLGSTNAVFGAITWTVTSGNGSVNGASTAVTAANLAFGEQLNWTLGPAYGTQTLTATVQDMGATGPGPSATYTFTATATAPRIGGTCTSGATELASGRSITGGEVWTLAGSPYRVGDVTVNNGATLRIEPGVTVCVQGSIRLLGGRLQAEGSADRPVVLTVPDPARDTWALELRASNTYSAAPPAVANSTLRFVRADNLRSLLADEHGLRIEDSRFVMSPAVRATVSCAQVVLRSGSAPSAGLQPHALLRSVFEGYGSSGSGSGSGSGCDAALWLDARAALPAGPHLLQSRVQGSIGDGVAVSAVSGAPAWALSQCEVIGNGRNGIRFDSGAATATLPGATVAGCSITGQAGLAVSSALPAGSVVQAQRNWWGQAAGPANGGANGVSAGVDASLPLTAPPDLGY